MRYVVGVIVGVVLLAVAALAGIVALDSPTPPPPLLSVSAPFETVDFSDLPPVLHYTARDGADLAYRRYAGDADRLVVLIHGSAGSSSSMHAVAKALAAAGATVIVPDVRGHGRSGPHGDIGYIGQLENDLDDLMSSLERAHRPRETTLIGFSSGGGFALRVAGGRLGQHFSRTILLAPYLRHDAPNTRTGTGSGGWVSVAVPRIVALLLVNHLGVTAFNGLPVVAFALEPGNPHHLVAHYSYRLLMNFQPDDDYLGDLRRISRPVMALEGADDEIFLAGKLQGALAAGRPGIRVDIVPGVRHIGLITKPAGTAAIVRAWASRF
nr:alpha/beta hydrolase [uncultured Lichenicoccus sp.]